MHTYPFLAFLLMFIPLQGSVMPIYRATESRELGALLSIAIGSVLLSRMQLY